MNVRLELLSLEESAHGCTGFCGGTRTCGAHEWNRTIDLLLTKEVLYRLSYVSVGLLQRSSVTAKEPSGILPGGVLFRPP